MKLGKLIGFAWFTITTPSWMPKWIEYYLFSRIDDIGDRYIPGFTDGVILAYKEKARVKMYSIAEKKLLKEHDEPTE